MVRRLVTIVSLAPGLPSRDHHRWNLRNLWMPFVNHPACNCSRRHAFPPSVLSQWFVT